ncbi:nucleotidyltransferase domain-containing protein, partial [Dehalobacter sp. UNSWDHB]|uniref:nucleotidyltransferase domain-containing protein n=1 Tax=Dehalobacter sp. UNSWDHB TaxID=1339256 RepID=UPI000551284A
MLVQTNSALPQISNELKFVLNCTNNSEIKDQDLITALDWDKVLTLAYTHGFYPIIYNAIKQLNNARIPDCVMSNLKHCYIKNVFKTMSLADEIVRITRDLNNNDVKSFILKGPPLSIKTNEDITLRPSNDIDILVDPLEFNRAEKTLEQLDYIRISPAFPLTPRQKKFFFRHDHHFEYYNHKRATLVELHWRIRSYNIKRFPSAFDLNAQNIILLEYPVSVMDDEYWFVYLMVHGYKHMWARLRWLYDLKRLMNITLDWDKIILIADKSE